MDKGFGIVLAIPEANCPDRETRAYVLDVEFLMRTGLPIALPVDDAAFRLPVNSHNIEVSVKKNKERKLERLLFIGECISWNEEDCIENENGRKTVIRFNRQKKLFPCRVENGVGQFLMEGIINPKAPQNLYTDFIHAIPIPENMQNDAWPNIYYQVWICMKCDESGDVRVEFGSFHGVCKPDKQIDVAAAPWNESSTIYTSFPPPPSDDSDDEFGGYGHLIANRPKKYTGPPMEIYGHDATLTGDRTLIIWIMPNKKVVLPLKSCDLDPVDAYWNDYEKMYMVSKIVPINKNELIARSPNGQILIPVTAIESIRGLFQHHLFGIIDDPNGILRLLHLTGFALSPIQVLINDGCPSRGGQIRFSIADIGEEKTDLYEKWKQEKLPTKILERVAGIVVDGQRAFSQSHYPNFFRFHINDSAPAIGSRISLSAKYNSEKEEFEIIDWRIDPYSLTPLSVIRRMNLKDPNSKQAVFYVKGIIPAHPELTQILTCTEFGLIDDNLGLLTFDKENAPGKVYRVWVTEAHGGDQLEPRSVFHVVAFGKNPPDDRVKVEEPLSAENMRVQKEFRNIVQDTVEEQKSVQSKRHLQADPGESGMPQGNIFQLGSGDNPFNIFQHGNGENPFKNLAKYGIGVDLEPRSDPFDRVSVSSFTSDNTLRPPSQCSSVYTSNVDYSREDPSATFDDNSSELTCNGGIFPPVGFKENHKKNVEKYTGPVKMPPGSDQKFNVVETLSRLKRSVKHSPNCAFRCAHGCPWLGALALLVVSVSGFWQETEKNYPQIAAVLLKCIKNLQGSDDD